VEIGSGVQSTLVPSDQTNRATGLTLAWDPADAGGPAHQRLAAALRAQVGDGRLQTGDRLPPTRVLAEELGLSRWVVTEAYDQLKAEGYLTGRVGSGTVVAGRSAVVPSPSAPPRRTASGAATAAPADLSPALPDLSSFPRAAWRTALTKALASATDADLGYPHPAGAPALRATMAGYLRRVRGLDVDAGRVHVTQGVRNAVALVCRTLRARGARRIAVEDPSWPRMSEVARGSGLDVVPVPVDAGGMQVERLAGLDADAVFVTPTHQFPTGVPLTAQRRLALIDWATAPDGSARRLVVEDDYDAEFRYDRRPVGALAARAPGCVVYLGSTSKTLGPGVHLGWMVAPAGLHDDLASAREAVGGLPPTLDQLALVHLIDSGGYDRHLRRMRRVYQQRRAALLAALAAAHAPGAPAASMDAGLHVLWLLPDGAREAAVLIRAQERGLTLLGLSQCRVAPGAPGLVLGYGNVTPHRAAAIAATITAAISGAVTDS
jgi:GntR family transcriptional regulator/MocR family aminotransferase